MARCVKCKKEKANVKFRPNPYLIVCGGLPGIVESFKWCLSCERKAKAEWLNYAKKRHLKGIAKMLS